MGHFKGTFTKTGFVVLKKINIGSGNEHDAVVLMTDEGDFPLQRTDVYIFNDQKLRNLIGSIIEGTGTILNTGTFALDAWKIIDA